MLKKLDIRNFTLIDHLEMALYPGFSVITGETGAGKSIVIGAIGLLLGNRADAKQVKRGCDKCIIEATFDLSIYHSDVLKDFFEDTDLDYEPASEPAAQQGRLPAERCGHHCARPPTACRLSCGVC